MKRGAGSKKIRGLSEARLVDVCRVLNKHGARYLIVGGVACNLHGLIRATRDIDLLIPKDVENTNAVLEALKEGLMFGVAGELDAEEVAENPMTIVGDVPRVDLLTVANKVSYEQAAKTARYFRIDGVKIYYVDFDTLIKTKDTGRLQDEADIERLKRIRTHFKTRSS